MGHYQGMSSQFFIWKLTAVSMEICQLSPTFRTGITQSLRLEKTFKTNKSNHCSSTAKSTTKPCPQVLHLHIFSIPPGVVPRPLLQRRRDCVSCQEQLLPAKECTGTALYWNVSLLALPAHLPSRGAADTSSKSK